MNLLLKREPNGLNKIIDAGDNICLNEQVKKINHFLKSINKSKKRDLVEIAQVLKIRWEDIDDLVEQNGFITREACENIMEYYSKHRISPKELLFLQQQCGNAGIKNHVPVFK